MEIEKHPTFNKETAMLFHEMLYEAKQLIDKLSSVDLITPESIKNPLNQLKQPFVAVWHWAPTAVNASFMDGAVLT